MATKKTDIAAQQDIPAQIETIRADIALLTKTLKEQTKATVADKAATAKNVAQEKTDMAKVKYDEMSSKAEASIKENPLTAVAIAVGAGMLLGALTRR